MKLIITRHGENMENRDNIIQGHLHGKFSKKGKIQVKKLTEFLKNEKIDVVFSSDLDRASDTAKEVLKFHEGVTLKLVKEPRERNLGELQGKSHPEQWKKIALDSKIIKKSKLENLKDKTVLVIAHKGINNVLICYIKDGSLGRIKDMEDTGNTSITIFNFDKNGKALMEVFNSMKHLEKQ